MLSAVVSDTEGNWEEYYACASNGRADDLNRGNGIVIVLGRELSGLREADVVR